MGWKMASALAGAKATRRLTKGAKKIAKSPAGRAIASPPGVFALGALVALPLGWAAIRSLRKS